MSDPVACQCGHEYQAHDPDLTDEPDGCEVIIGDWACPCTHYRSVLPRDYY